jgi:hypothetical protein
MPEQMWQGTQ